MVGTLAVRLPDLDKTIWINCNDEGVTITSADYVWNEDDSGSWERYEDVVMFEVNFRDDDPQSMWPLLPAIHECILDVDVEAKKMKVHLMEGLL